MTKESQYIYQEGVAYDLPHLHHVTDITPYAAGFPFVFHLPWGVSVSHWRATVSGYSFYGFRGKHVRVRQMKREDDERDWETKNKFTEIYKKWTRGQKRKNKSQEGLREGGGRGGDAEAPSREDKVFSFSSLFVFDVPVGVFPFPWLVHPNKTTHIVFAQILILYLHSVTIFNSGSMPSHLGNVNPLKCERKYLFHLSYLYLQLTRLFCCCCCFLHIAYTKNLISQ